MTAISPQEVTQALMRTALVALCMLLVACTSTPREERAAAGAVSPTVTPTATTQPVLVGAVLGATKENWVAAKGQPSKGPVMGERFGKDLDVLWRAGADGAERARHVELLLDREEPIGRARDLAKGLHPKDATSVRTYTAPAGQTVEVFRSGALAAAHTTEAFGDEEAGTYIQIAERGSPRTARVVIALGNNP